MDVKDIATYGTAVAVIGTGTVVGGNNAIDRYTGGPEKRIEAEKTELQMIVREEVRAAFLEAWPKNSGPVTNLGPNPNGNYRDIVNPNKK